LNIQKLLKDVKKNRRITRLYQTESIKKTTFGTQVINALMANAETFPNLPVLLALLTSSNNALIAAVNAASTGDHYAVANLKAVIKEWNNNFRLTANYISNVADGDAAIVRLAGFVPTKGETTPAQKPDAPSNFYAAANGTKGLINASCTAKNKNALIFVAAPPGADISFIGDSMLITAGNVTVQVLTSTKNKVSFNNIPGGVIMDMSVYAVNTAGIGPLANGQSVITK
jgi:hypothetical protein